MSSSISPLYDERDDVYIAVLYKNSLSVVKGAVINNLSKLKKLYNLLVYNSQLRNQNEI